MPPDTANRARTADRESLGATRALRWLTALGGVFAGRPELVDGGEGLVEAFGGKRFEMGRRRVGFGRREFGGDEGRLPPVHPYRVCQRALGMIPALARRARTVPAAAAGEHDEVVVAEQAGMGLGVD